MNVSSRAFDVVVIGGGISGAGIAREAALRGASVALLEAADYASGTSSRSSKLIHGGLRYLALGDVALVRSTALERVKIRRLAPHLAEPRWMVLPTRSRAGMLKFRVAIATYEKLGAVESCDRHQTWGPDDLEREEPLLDRVAHSAMALGAAGAYFIVVRAAAEIFFLLLDVARNLNATRDLVEKQMAGRRGKQS